VLYFQLKFKKIKPRKKQFNCFPFWFLKLAVGRRQFRYWSPFSLPVIGSASSDSTATHVASIATHVASIATHVASIATHVASIATHVASIVTHVVMSTGLQGGCQYLAVKIATNIEGVFASWPASIHRNKFVILK
jgi:lysylphosphatidylglycerol synthetase-like protein (DUF2156 family)